MHADMLRQAGRRNRQTYKDVYDLASGASGPSPRSVWYYSSHNRGRSSRTSRAFKRLYKGVKLSENDLYVFCPIVFLMFTS